MEQVDRALNRFLSVKRQYGLFEAAPVDLNAIDAHIATRPNLAAAAAIARESLTLLKNERSVLPLPIRRSAHPYHQCKPMPRRTGPEVSWNGLCADTPGRSAVTGWICEVPVRMLYGAVRNARTG